MSNTIKFTEEQLEKAIIQLLEIEGYTYVKGEKINRKDEDVLIEDDLRTFLKRKYNTDKITLGEIKTIIRKLKSLPASDLYESNKIFMKMLSDGFNLKREDRLKKDLYVQLIDYTGLTEFRLPRPDEVITIGEQGYTYGSDKNIIKIVNQLEITGSEKRIPDGILYINGLPVVVFEFKSAIREETTIYDAFIQLTVRYQRDIPELFKYNAFCVISDGVNNKSGSFFAPYEFFYTWRKVHGSESIEPDGINSLYTMIQGLFNRNRLRDVIRNFIYLPDSSRNEEKILCRYPQYYATRKLFENIKEHQKPDGDGKGGTYFGATGCGKSFTMLFLARMLMKSVYFSSPTIVLITDRTDLDDQLTGQFTNAKGFIGDDSVISVESRTHLREMLKDRNSGGVFLTTIHKFTEDIELLSDRSNIICISDEAHRTQTNLDQKVRVTEKGVKKTYGFAKYLHDSLPNATYVGFTGTPIDSTLEVFGPVADSYTMNESVQDEITVRIVYEGRAAKVILNNSKLQDIEKYYDECAEAGTSEYQIDESKRANTSMEVILSDPDRVQALTKDFVQHYENRVNEGSTVKGKAMFVCYNRKIAWLFYQALRKIRPDWFIQKAYEEGIKLTDREKKELKPIEKVKMVMTRGKDDPAELYKLLGTKEYGKELDRQFKYEKSNFQIAIVVDMWLTGFDVPFLDSIYIDKPIQQHSLIQTISRVNRKFKGKNKGLVVDYIGIKTHMNRALKKYNTHDKENFEDIEKSIIIVRNHLDLLSRSFIKFNTSPYFTGQPLEQLDCLNKASEYVLVTKESENRFMKLVKRLKAAYDICSGSEELIQSEKDHVHFYLAVRSIVFKLTRGEAPDLAQMNSKVRDMIAEALKSNGVEEIFKLGDDKSTQIDIFDEDYLSKIEKIKLPLTKIQLLQQLLAKAIDEIKKVNKIQGFDFSKKFNALVEKYNERKEEDILVSSVLEDFTDEIIDLYQSMKNEMESFGDLGIDFEEKAFYDILKMLTKKYDFAYPEEKLIALAKEVKITVNEKVSIPDWNEREEIKALLKAELIMLLDKHGYPPVEHDEVYKEIFEQAENFKKYSNKTRSN